MDRLTEYRKHVDTIDKNIVELFKKRAEIVVQIQHWKQRFGLPVYQKEREQAIYRWIKSHNSSSLLSNQSLEKIYQEVLRCFRALG